MSDAPATTRRPATQAEARALANPLRLQILRLCLDRSLTNKQLAEHVGRDPGTILHHVRTLVETGFLAAEEARRGPRGSVERPYRATRKSWTLDIGFRRSNTLAMVDAFRAELAAARPRDVVATTRLGVRLGPRALREFRERLGALTEELAASDDPDGTPYGLFVGLHRRREPDPE